MSTTITHLLPSAAMPSNSPTLHLTLKHVPEALHGLSSEVLQLALDSLGIIVDTYLEWDERDALSKQLMEWAFEVLELDASTPDSQEALENRVHVLKNQILINSLDRAPLKSPILVNQILWEKWMWDDYNTCFPQTSRSFEIHRFAVEVISWVNALPFTCEEKVIGLSQSIFEPIQFQLPALSSPHLNQTLLTSFKDPQSQILKLFAYCQLAGSALTTQKIHALRLQMEEGASVIHELWIRTRETVLLECERSEKEADAHCLIINSGLEEIEQAHQQTAATLKSLIEQGRHELNVMRKRLENSEQKTIIQERQIRNLREAIYQQEREITQIHQGKKKKKFGVV